MRFIAKLLGKGRSVKKTRRSELSRLEHRIGYSFKDIRLLEAALSHLSYVNEAGLEYVDSNERLEFLGDAVLDLVVSEYLYDKLHDAREGDLTRIKSSVVSRAALAEAAAELSLEDYILFSRDSFPDLKRGRRSVTSNSLEAIIGAIYIDGGPDEARGFVCRHLLRGINVELSYDNLQEAKNSLLHLAQVHFRCQPGYRIVEAAGPEHARRFVCEVSIGKQVLGRGVGASKKESEKRAAVEALKALEKQNITID